MAAFDYTTPAEAFAYGGSAGAGTDPINEQAAMAGLVTSVSRAIDQACRQTLYLNTYTDERYRATIDREGVLTVALPVPTASAITSASYRIGTSWLSPVLADADIEAHPHGCVVRFLSSGLLAYRGNTIPVKLSYTGGYASAAAMPADLRLAAQAAAWYEFQRRYAPQDKTAMPAMGVVVIPGSWPKHILDKLAPHTRPIAS